MSGTHHSVVHAGDDWLLARFAGEGDPVAISLAIQGAADAIGRSGNWLEIVPGVADLAVRFDPMAETPAGAEMRLSQALDDATPLSPDDQPLVEIPVCYGGAFGPDLEQCAAQLGIGAEEIIRRHGETIVTVQMMGFAPGFAYCGQISDRLFVDRLAEPRREVAAGSVGIVGRQTCLYSLAGPGGWPLIGRTPVPLLDMTAETPFRLSAGMRLRFVPISAEEFQARQESL